MTKGTPSRGKHGKKSNMTFCRRCGSKSFHRNKKKCSACGFGDSPKMKAYTWAKK